MSKMYSMHMMQCHWTKQRLKTLLLFLCIRTKEGPTREKNIPRKCNLQPSLSFLQKEERISPNEKASTLFEFESSSSSRTKNRSAPHLRFPRKPEEEFKKKKTISSSLRCTGKMKWGRNFEAVLNMEAASRLGKRRRRKKKKLISFPFSLHNFSTVRLRN